MADKTIDDFNAVVTPATTDVLIISQANVAKKETVAQLDTLLSATTKTLTNKTLTSPVVNTAISGTAIDTDGTLAANSDTKLASQKATKTYVDTVGATKQNLATALTALAALTPAAYTLPVFSSATSATSFVIDEQTLVGRITGGLVAALTATQVRTLLSLVIGTNVQAYDAAYANKTVKGWVHFGGASATVDDSYNVSTVDDGGTGTFTVNWDTNFTDDKYAANVSTSSDGANLLVPILSTITSGALEVLTVKRSDGNAADPVTCCVIAIGDQ